MSTEENDDVSKQVSNSKQVEEATSHGGQGCSCSDAAGGLYRRCGKRCRLRGMEESSRPDVDENDMKRHRKFGEDEEDLIIKLHALLGDRWSLIAGRLPGRTDKEIENYWNSYMKRKLMSMGIDPNNHRPNQPAVVVGPYDQPVTDSEDDGLSDATSFLQE